MKKGLLVLALLGVALGSACTTKFAHVPTVGMMNIPFAPLRHGVDYEVEQIKTGEECGWIPLPFLLKPIAIALYGDPYDNIRIKALNEIMDKDSTAILPMSFSVQSTDWFLIETYCGRVQAAAIKFIKRGKKRK